MSMNPTPRTNQNSQSFLQRNIRLGVWGGVGGAVIGATTWILVMAGLSGDWLTVALTLALDVVVLFLFGKLCLRHSKKRFLLLGLLLVILTVHCLIMYWWRLDLWRISLDLGPDELLRQKKVVTYTVGGMVTIVLGQLLVMHWLQQRGRVAR